MFAQTISSRNPTAPISTTSAGRDVATSCSRAAITRVPQPALLSLYSEAIRLESTFSSCCACGRSTPWRVRPITTSDRARREDP